MEDTAGLCQMGTMAGKNLENLKGSDFGVQKRSLLVKEKCPGVQGVN
jgi:hypothetical protein